jgi:hypothetical protein
MLPLRSGRVGSGPVPRVGNWSRRRRWRDAIEPGPGLSGAVAANRRNVTNERAAACVLGPGTRPSLAVCSAWRGHTIR